MVLPSLSAPTSDGTAYVAEQCLVEHKTLSHVKAALRLALDWQVGPPGLPRKLATVRFTAQSFRRHLERPMSLEEKDGYMLVVGELKPNLVEKAMPLQQEHDFFRADLERLLGELEGVGGTQTDAAARWCEELRQLLDRVDRHEASETELLQDVVMQDDGGEGG